MKHWLPKFLSGILTSLCLLWGGLAVAQESAATHQLRLLFAGDVMGHTGQIKSAEVEANQLYDYSPCFEFVKPMVESADLAIANLELTLPGEPPYLGYPQFRSPDDLALALKEAGFDILVTANNHSNDAGKSGLINTLEVLDRYRILHTGTFRDAAERKVYYPLLVYKGNFKIALLNYTYGTNGLTTKPPTVVNLIDENLIREDLLAAQSFQPDAIIVMMHWGLEYQLQENSEQQQLAKKMFDWGADLVIGAHPHVVQPIKELEIARNGSRKKVLVAYSLGNYISGQTKKNTDGGIMLEIILEKNSLTNQTILKNHHFIPVWRYIDPSPAGKKTYRILPAGPVEENMLDGVSLSPSSQSALQSYFFNLRNHLKNSDCQEQPITVAK